MSIFPRRGKLKKRDSVQLTPMQLHSRAFGVTQVLLVNSTRIWKDSLNAEQMMAEVHLCASHHYLSTVTLVEKMDTASVLPSKSHAKSFMIISNLESEVRNLRNRDSILTKLTLAVQEIQDALSLKKTLGHSDDHLYCY